jgi:hypothetical protein
MANNIRRKKITNIIPPLVLDFLNGFSDFPCNSALTTPSLRPIMIKLSSKFSPV